MSENWVDGSYESGSDQQPDTSQPPEQEKGATLGQGEGSTFEPEEDAGESADE